MNCVVLWKRCKFPLIDALLFDLYSVQYAVFFPSQGKLLVRPTNLRANRKKVGIESI